MVHTSARWCQERPGQRDRPHALQSLEDGLIRKEGVALLHHGHLRMSVVHGAPMLEGTTGALITKMHVLLQPWNVEHPLLRFGIL